MQNALVEYTYFDRDISWLAFNERVLMEAEKENVPLLERIKFLSIYSSNLDEFYRVRMPVVKNKPFAPFGGSLYERVADIINGQQNRFGVVLGHSLIPELRKLNIHFCYKEGIPASVASFATNFFFSQIAGFLQPVFLKGGRSFFPENNLLYLVVVIQNAKSEEQICFVNIPTNHIERFVKARVGEEEYIIFLEDIIKQNLRYVFPDATSIEAYNIKVTRDAELDLLEDDGGELTDQFEKQLSKRDTGFATRFLYEPGLPERHLQNIIDVFDLETASVVEGGRYHNLKDLAELPVKSPSASYPPWPPIQGIAGVNDTNTLFDALTRSDLMVHAPYQSYDTILRFFNEAAINPEVEEIYTTLYRVAHDSKIVHALISAARNRKKVTVLVELKARFDEANNIRWAKRMKAAGVKIVHSVNALKVHAKIALIKRKHPTTPYLGLMATGNLNEGTARFYTDHILLTSNQAMLIETEKLFGFLSKKKKPEKTDAIAFKHLLVAQFNLQTRFLELIEREIGLVKAGRKGQITIKLNNLEEEVLINKLYDASNAGVTVNLIVRSICRLVPGIPGQSENITIKRIVDRYLEHGRVFIFANDGEQEVYMGSADWMNRNIYRRIEVCFPIYSRELKQQLTKIISLQWNDNAQAVFIDQNLNNIEPDKSGIQLRSQKQIYEFLSEKRRTD